MGWRGVHFAIGPSLSDRLLAATDDADLRSIVIDEIEEAWDRDWLYQTDKAWEGIHRALTDGKLEYVNGAYPLNACILGGQQLHEEDDYVISYVAPQQVADVATALTTVDKDALAKGYAQIEPDDYFGTGPSAEDFDYVWEWFTGLPDFFSKAANANRAVIFTVDT